MSNPPLSDSRDGGRGFLREDSLNSKRVEVVEEMDLVGLKVYPC